MGRVKGILFEKLKKIFAVPKNQGRFFLIIGLIALIFGSWRIINTIKSPFQIDQSKLLAQSQVQNSVEDQIKSLTELRTKDTDNDGLSDYDELVYRTSPYLEDSDSDSYFDKLEIETGNDPLCPAGQKCLLVDSQTVTTSSQAKVTTEALIDPYKITPAEIRQLLINSGLDQATLDEIDDVSLQQMFLQAYLETENQVGTISGQNNTTTAEPIISSPAQLRELLIVNGVPAEQVNAYSDQELMDIYEQIRAEGN